jgi:hypothetical protein
VLCLAISLTLMTKYKYTGKYKYKYNTSEYNGCLVTTCASDGSVFGIGAIMYKILIRVTAKPSCFEIHDARCDSSTAEGHPRALPLPVQTGVFSFAGCLPLCHSYSSYHAVACLSKKYAICSS